MSKERAPEGYKQTEVGVIPEDWNVQHLENLTEQVRPISYGIVQTGPNIFGGVPCLRVVDIKDGHVDARNLIRTSEKISNGYKRTILRTGDLVMPLRGKVGDVGIINEELEGANLTRGVAVLAIRPDIDNKFCRQAISSPSTRRRLEQSMNGSALQEIPIATLRSFQIAIPSLIEEQQAIASTLSNIDNLLASLDRLIAKKRDLKQATMQQLLTGKQRLPGFLRESGYQQTEIGVIPKDWNVRLLPDIAWFQEGPGLRNWQFVNQGMKVINVTNLENGFLNLDRTDRYITLEEFSKTYAHFAIDADDIVMASSGNSYCKTSVVRDHDLPLVMNTSVIRFKPINNYDYNFLLIYLRSASFKEQIDLMITGGAQPNFGPYHLKRIYLPVPSDKEQTAIAQVLTDMDTELTTLQTRRTKTQALKQAMMQELLTGKTRLLPPTAKND